MTKREGNMSFTGSQFFSLIMSATESKWLRLSIVLLIWMIIMCEVLDWVKSCEAKYKERKNKKDDNNDDRMGDYYHHLDENHPKEHCFLYNSDFHTQDSTAMVATPAPCTVVQMILKQKQKRAPPWEILGVLSTSDLKQVNKAYRDLAMCVHPDKNSEEGATEAFQAVAHAYELMSQ